MAAGVCVYHLFDRLIRVESERYATRRRESVWRAAVNQYGALAHNEQWDAESDSVITYWPTRTGTTTTTTTTGHWPARNSLRGRTDEDEPVLP